MKLNNNVIKKIVDDSGAVSVMFAGIFPVLIVFYSLAMDGANFNSKRARLMDGIHQGVHAVALTDNRNASSVDRNNNRDIMKNYLSYYLGKQAEISNSDIAINATVVFQKDEKGNNTSVLQHVDYTASASVKMKTNIMPYSRAISGTGFDPELAVAADRNSGVVRKRMDIISRNTDFLFAVDLSESMDGSRFKKVREVLSTFAKSVTSDKISTSTIGFVPFSIGTPVVLDKKNVKGGSEYGCSFAAKLKENYLIDFSYWYNKNIDKSDGYQKKDKKNNVSDDIERAAYDADESRYKYYNKIEGDDDNKVAFGWCKKNKEYGKSVGRYDYSCETEEETGIFDKNGDISAKFTAQYKNANALIRAVKANHDHANIVNANTIDITKTLADGFLFEDSAVTTYVQNYFKDYRPFPQMCKNVADDEKKDFSSTGVRPLYYVVPLTRDIDELNKINGMDTKGVGYSDTINGLLRAVPEVAKGQNSRKVIVLITDGKDTGDEDEGPEQLRDILLRDNKLCDVIRKGLVDYSKGGTSVAEIYYMSFKYNRTRMNFWADNCVGADKSITINDLLSELLTIAQEGELTYINQGD